MTRRLTRRTPQLLILLDMITLWILALLSQPVEPGGVTYKFLGLPPGSLLFAVDLPLRPDQRRWTYFDLESNTWVARAEVTPHGRENFMCNECARFLPTGTQPRGPLMIGLPPEMREKIHEAFFMACHTGDCNHTLYVDAKGNVTTTPSK